MEIPEKLKLEYLLALDNHIETVGKDNKEVTMKKIFEITKEIADLGFGEEDIFCLLYTSPSPRDRQKSRMPSSA